LIANSRTILGAQGRLAALARLLLATYQCRLPCNEVVTIRLMTTKN